MAPFAYRARRRSGEVVQGTVDVPDRSAALLQIERLGLFAISVDASRATVPGAAPAEAPAKPGRINVSALMPQSFQAYLKRQRRPKLQELSTFTQQLANLLRSGMPLTVALNSMTYLETKGIPSTVSRDLRQDVMEGKSLSDAMRRQPVVFSDLYVNMVKAGEQSGALVEVLKRLAEHFERFAEVQSKFKSALIYPAFVGVVGAVIITFFMTFMLPKFLTIFEGLQVQLPLATRILIGFSHFIAHYWWLLLSVIIVAFVLFNRFRSTAHGKRTIDGWKLNMPLFGKVNRLNLFGQFARTLSTLLENGVPVLVALQITEQIIPNIILKEAIDKTRKEVTDGKTISQPLARSKLFPQLMVDLVRIGEETGDVPGALSNLAETYEGDLTLALRVMTNLIEPVLIVVMAMGVGFLLLSVLSAMFAITSSIAR